MLNSCIPHQLPPVMIVLMFTNLLNRHNNLYRVQAVQSQIVREVRGVGELHKLSELKILTSLNAILYL